MQYGKRTPLIEQFIERNEKINLSAIREPNQIYQKHILDSLEITNILSLQPGKDLLDLGTGGGFPLLPIATEHPDLRCIGLDGRKKKLTAVQAIAESCDLQNVETVWSRAEDHNHTYQYVTARAVAYIDKLLPRASPLVAPGGCLILYKKYTPEEDGDLHHLLTGHHLQLKKEHRYANDRIIYLLHNPIR